MKRTRGIGRRSLLRSALIGSALAASAGPVLASGGKSVPADTTGRPTQAATPEARALLKYAGEFGGGKHR